MKKSSVSRMQWFMYSQILCYVLERWIRTQHQILFGSDSWNGSKIHHNTELWTQSTENRWNSSGICPRIQYIAARRRSPKVHEQNVRTRHNSKDELSSCRCSMTSHGEIKTMKRNVLLIPHLCLCSQKDFQQDVGHSFLGPGSEKKWYSTCNERPRGEWDRVAELMMIKFRESGHPVFRATSPLSRGVLKGKGGGKLSVHFCADGDTIETVFRTIISVNQLSVNGAVSELCERNTVPVRQARGDPCWQGNLTHCSSQQNY